MVKYIELNNGIQTIVDDDMYSYLSQWNWKASNDSYVYRTGRKEDGQYYRKRILMHRIVNNTPEGYITDHIDRNKLNNTKENLRTCNHSDNGANIAPFENKSSKYKGVSYYSKIGKWRARIEIEGTFIHIAYFKCEKAAAEAYNVKAKEIYGEFAFLNEIENHNDCEICKNVKKKKYKGVYKVDNKFRSIIVVNKQKIHLGYFHSEYEAARAYNLKAIELLGDKARLNYII